MSKITDNSFCRTFVAVFRIKPEERWLAAVLLTSSGELKALILIAAIFIVSAIGFRLIFSKNDPAEDASSPEPEEKQEEPHE